MERSERQFLSEGKSEGDLTCKKIKKNCSDYVRSINELTDAKKWRDKISGHFALTDPKGDNYITMNVSALNLTGFMGDRFVSKIFSVNAINPDETVQHADELPTWSLTKTFEELAPRFWPELKFP